jgi:dephospho-CoA kinase
MLILGLIGSPAGGKSTVARYLVGLGATWIDADLIARGVLEEDDVQAQLIGHFGRQITDRQGRIERTKLAARVFGDDDLSRTALKYLEGVIHPRTRRLITGRLRELERQGAGVVILDVPLLLEAGWDRSCDEIWCVDADRFRRLERARPRGWDEHHLNSREANQVDIEEKKRLSNVVIYNNGTLDQLYETVDRHWSSLQQRQEEPLADATRHCALED